MLQEAIHNPCVKMFCFNYSFAFSSQYLELPHKHTTYKIAIARLGTWVHSDMCCVAFVCALHYLMDEKNNVHCNVCTLYRTVQLLPEMQKAADMAGISVLSVMILDHAWIGPGTVSTALSGPCIVYIVYLIFVISFTQAFCAVEIFYTQN